MIERAIENWLINTNERNYQVPFCQVLISQGHEILYISPHGALEFGKDIISIDKDANIHAYQLKTGNISLSVWDTIHREVMQDLVNTACDHPNIDKKKPHISHLVTNGNIDDNVFQRIDKVNKTTTNFSKLETINKDQLLKYFIEAQGGFIPKSFEEFQEFLSFFQLKGNEFFPKKKFFMFFKNQVLQTAKQKSNVLNGIFASVILTSYLLKNFQEKKNHFAQFEAWTVLYFTLAGFIEEEKQSDKKVDKTLKLIKETILEILNELCKEFVNKDNLLEGAPFGDGDLVYRARVTIVLGLICCNKYYYNTNSDEVIQKKVVENLKYVWFWGESSFPYVLSIIKYLEKKELFDSSSPIINTVLEGILNHNGFRNKEQAFPNPYYDINTIFESVFCNKPIDYKQFKASSYILNPLIEIIARRNLKPLLEKNWRKLSHIQINKFIADKDYELFYYWNKKGINYSNFSQQMQSWKELQNVSKTKISNHLLEKYRGELPLFLLVYPHRISEDIIKYIDF